MKPIKTIPMLILLLALMIAPACDTFEEVNLGEEPAPVYVEPVYTDNGDGTITDTTSNGIMWAKCANNQSGTPCAGVVSPISFAAAKTYCENLVVGTITDWRLPTKAELATLAYGTVTYTTYFPNYNTEIANYWWSSTSVNESLVYAVKYNPDPMEYDERYFGTSTPEHTRCVRAIQP